MFGGDLEGCWLACVFVVVGVVARFVLVMLVFRVDLNVCACFACTCLSGSDWTLYRVELLVVFLARWVWFSLCLRLLYTLRPLAVGTP